MSFNFITKNYVSVLR